MRSRGRIVCLALVALTSVYAENRTCDEGWIYNPPDGKCIKLLTTSYWRMFSYSPNECRQHKWGLGGNTSAELFNVALPNLPYVTDYLRFLGQTSAYIKPDENLLRKSQYRYFRHYDEFDRGHGGFQLMLSRDAQDSIKIGFVIEVPDKHEKNGVLCQVDARSSDRVNVSCPNDVQVVSTTAVSATLLVVPGNTKGRIQVQLLEQWNSSLPVTIRKQTTLFPVQAVNHTVEGLQPDTRYNVTFLADTNVTGQSFRCDLTLSIKTSQASAVSATLLVVPGNTKGRIHVQLSEQWNSSLPATTRKNTTLFPVQAVNHTVEGLQPDTRYNVTWFLADTNVTGQNFRCDLTLSFKTSQAEPEQKCSCLSNSLAASSSPVTNESPPHVAILSVLLGVSALAIAVLGFLFWRTHTNHKQGKVEVSLIINPQANKAPERTEASPEEEKYVDAVSSDPEKVPKTDSDYLNVCRTSNAYDRVNTFPEVENVYEK